MSHALCTRRIPSTVARTACTLRIRTHSTKPSTVVTRSSATEAASLISWAHSPEDSRQQPAVCIHIQQAPDQRCLVAARDVEPGEVVLSVPFTKVFSGEADGDIHWAADMALRLLQEKHRQQTGEGSSFAPWLQWLPSAVTTPVQFTEEEVGEVQYPDTQREVLNMQQCLADCYEELQGELEVIGAGWGDFLWAVQVFHSRCFFEPAMRQHLCVPGVDMANHSPTPNAEVRMVRSPDECQGGAAVEDVCEPPPPSPPRFELLAGASGIRSGEEVSISYGSWPNDVFFELFGFVLDPNPNDSILLYHTPEELVQHYMELAGVSDPSAMQLVSSAVSARLEGGAQQWGRLVVNWQGLDWRLEEILKRIGNQAMAAAIPCQKIPAGVLVAAKCKQLLGSFPTTAEEDKAILDKGQLSDNMSLAVSYRLGKKLLLKHVLKVYGD